MLADFVVVIGYATQVETQRNIDETHQRVDLKKIFLHQKYDRKKKNNDIAILKLDKALTFNDNVKPACLPDSSVSNNGVGIASGWGDIDSKLYY